jgi:hypothetical protein
MYGAQMQDMVVEVAILNALIGLIMLGAAKTQPHLAGPCPERSPAPRPRLEACRPSDEMGHGGKSWTDRYGARQQGSLGAFPLAHLAIRCMGLTAIGPG